MITPRSCNQIIVLRDNINSKTKLMAYYALFYLGTDQIWNMTLSSELVHL